MQAGWRAGELVRGSVGVSECRSVGELACWCVGKLAGWRDGGTAGWRDGVGAQTPADPPHAKRHSACRLEQRFEGMGMRMRMRMRMRMGTLWGA